MEQHRSRDAYEVVREPIQNALDTGTDVYVRVDYADRSVVVEDHDPEGVDDLSQFYDLFAGDKQYDPETRGRFGRGVKEFIGASDETVIASAGGALRFNFEIEPETAGNGIEVDATREIYRDAVRDQGTVVYGKNQEWTPGDLAAVERFVEDLWMPDEQALKLEVYDTSSKSPIRKDHLTYEEPDAILENQYLPTLIVQDGIQQKKKRRTDIEVLKTEPGDGAVYELGIPVTLGEPFPFQFNVQQKTPVTERRNELDNQYRTDLMQAVLDERLDLLNDDELGEEYVTQYLSEFTHRISTSTQQEYIRRRFDEEHENLLVYTEDTPSIARIWATQRGLPMENANEYSRNVGQILLKHCPDVQEWYSEQTSERAIEPVDEISDSQAEFINYLEDEIISRTSTNHVDIELAFISEDRENGQTHATYSPADETIYLNAFADEWNEPTPRRIGTALHELGHHETDPTDDGHGPNWYKTVEKLSGDVIHDLLE